MKKALYIFEFAREDSENECEWFVGNSNWTYKQQKEACFKHLAKNCYYDPNPDKGYDALKTAKERCTVEGIFTVEEKMIKEVYESKILNKE